jgi:NADH-quinone oxidoreductase subunit J
VCLLLAVPLWLWQAKIRYTVFYTSSLLSLPSPGIILNAQFIAIVNIIVYAGAIMVLFLFVVMLMNLNAESEPQHKSKYMLYAGVIAGLSLMVLIVAALKKSDTVNQLTQMKDGDVGLIKNLGRTLFTDFVFPFEISSVLFLSAMIGAVVISKRDTQKINS